MWNKIITELLEDRKDISEIACNGTTSLFVRQKGQRVEIPNVFKDTDELIESINGLIERIKPGASKNNSEFLEEGTIHLTDGTVARCHIMLPPSCIFPNVTIARKTPDLTTLEAIHHSGSMNTQMYKFFKAALDMKLTMVLSGSTGAGKTTLLEALTKEWPNNVRVGVVEDAPELNLIQPNVFYLKSSVAKPGVPAENVATLDWCVAQLNRMRVDLIIIGETRGKEFAGFLTAANSGNEGSLTTIHAQNPTMALQKMNTFVNMAYAMPQRTINSTIASSVDVIVQLNKTVEGKYRITAIEEVTTQLASNENANIATHPLFIYDELADRWTSKAPSLTLSTKLKEYGYNMDYEKYSTPFESNYNRGLENNIFARRR